MTSTLALEEVIATRWLIPLLAATAILAGCGGSNESATTKWANNVCSAITTWQHSISSASESVKQSPSKETLEKAFGDVEGATKALTNELESAGKPPTQSGDQAKAAIDSLRTELDDDVQKMRDAVDTASNVGTTLNAVSVVSGTLAMIGDQVRATFNGLQQLEPKEELQTAIDQADACASLRG